MRKPCGTIGPALRQGALTAPYDLVLESRDAAYWIVIAKGRPPSRAASAVIDWLQAEAAGDGPGSTAAAEMRGDGAQP